MQGESAETPLIRSYMPELDSARGIAVLSVVFYHGFARPLHADVSSIANSIFVLSQYGWAGVNLFFVLSGFLITGILLDSKSRPDYFRRFYMRRAVRILPALYLMLLTLLIGGLASVRFTVISAVFLANFAGLMGVGLGYAILWSLAIEEHFYMLWPLIVRTVSTKALTYLAAIIWIGSPLLRLFLLQNPAPDHFAALYTWFNLDGLSLGALLAVWLRNPSFRRHQLARSAPLVMVASGIAFIFLVRHPVEDATVAKTACNLCFAGFLSCLLLVGTSKWKILVDRHVLKFFGFISYGLYLVHIFAFYLIDRLLTPQLTNLIASGRPMLATLLRFCAGLALATAIAYLSRTSIEAIFLRIGHGPNTKSSVLLPETVSAIQIDS